MTSELCNNLLLVGSLRH